MANVQLVEDLITLHNTVTIEGQNVSIRKLITPAKRIIFSNVTPIIPNEHLENAIRDVGYKQVSPVTFLRAGIHGDEYAHVLSFRRQIYVQPEDLLILPSSIVVRHEETDYRIFLNHDDLTCFLCKNPRHIANNCPNKINPTNEGTTETNNQVNTLIDEQQQLSQNMETVNPPEVISTILDNPNTGQVR